MSRDTIFRVTSVVGGALLAFVLITVTDGRAPYLWFGLLGGTTTAFINLLLISVNTIINGKK